MAEIVVLIWIFAKIADKIQKSVICIARFFAGN